MISDQFRHMDEQDSLAHLRSRFELPENKVYLDGNSLGALPRGVASRIDRVVREEWGDDLIASWNVHDWIGLPARVGDRIGRLIGAAPGQVVCADSISINLFKLLAAALSMQHNRNVILSLKDNFPTDLYMAQGLAGLLGPGRCQLQAVPSKQLTESLTDDVAVLMLTQVNFRDGRLHDIERLTRRAHERGILVLWDLAHSAGVVPLELDAWQVDMAVGCGYKYLNGGPGAPAFLYLAHRHHASITQPLSGWMGHVKPFDFSEEYLPSPDIRRFLAGTPGILGMAAMDAALDVFDEVTVGHLREKSVALTQAFIDLLDERELPGISLLSPKDPEQRGSQVSIAHEQAYAISQALIADGIIVDFRAPDVVRFGFSPLYNRFGDVGAALDSLQDIIKSQCFLDPVHGQRKTVT
jgi:kynureninase